MVGDEMPWALKGPTIIAQGFEGEGLPHQRALRPGLCLEHHVLRHNRGQILLALLVDATGIAGNRLPEVLASLYEALLPFEGSQACVNIYAYVPSVWTNARHGPLTPEH